ncbi:hypothetical protein [Roseomonas gilardii]|uniref:hypothetical protein n=1 Tax=Roseomonas gilardii TaxID=257708 RepID=UPI0011A945E9|nr:hypothetical protein [Roseomonas gilardii]
MADTIDSIAEVDLSKVGDAAATISTLARTHGVTAAPEPVDAFVDAATRLCDTEVVLDHTERLLVGLARAGVLTDEQRFALHAAYLRQQSGDIRPVW